MLDEYTAMYVCLSLSYRFYFLLSTTALALIRTRSCSHALGVIPWCLECVEDVGLVGSLIGK